MAAGGGRSSGNGKSAGIGRPNLLKSAGKSRKRKPDQSPINQCVTHNPKAKRLTEPLLRRLSAATAAADSFLRRNDLLLLPSQCRSLEYLLSSLPISPSAAASSAASAATWFHRFLSSVAGDGDPRWSHCFRVSRSTFSLLLSVLSPSLPSASPLPDYVLAAALHRLAHGTSFKFLARRFGFHSSADASRAFYTVCKLVNEKLGQQLDDPKPDFSPDLLPNCCGVIGFGRFEVEGELLGPNGSILVQALIDSKGRFVDISAGWPSTIKAKTIFRQTKLFSLAESESRTFMNGPLHKLSSGVSVPQYILGDSCFPLLPWLINPYSSSSNEEEDSFETSRREFNNAHSQAVRMFGNAFARVRARWQILNTKWKQETVEFLPFVITTACLLHNFLVDCGENIQDRTTDDIDNSMLRMKNEDEKEDEEDRDYEEETDLGAKRIRDAIAENLSRIGLKTLYQTGLLLYPTYKYSCVSTVTVL